MAPLGFPLFLLFTISWFLRIPARVPFLGEIRLDLILAALLVISSVLSPKPTQEEPSESGTPSTGGVLRLLLIYILLTVPFVEWPGSVLKVGLERFLKAALFYFFSTRLIRTESQLKAFISVFLGCQLIRILEPLYLNITQGYWGERASMADWQSLNRLAGSPYDVIGANGLAFVILTVIPFLIFFGIRSVRFRLLAMLLLPILMYTLLLTGSRSGMVGLMALGVAIFAKLQRKLVFAALSVVVLLVVFLTASPDQQDRFLSLFSSDTKNAATLEFRKDTMLGDFSVALRRPIFGHGLGTSLEANSHFRETYLVSHTLYLELIIELGVFGLAIFLAYIYTVVTNFTRTLRKVQSNPDSSYLATLVHAMQVWLFMNILFAFASYGLSSYEWYLFGGLSIVVHRIASDSPLPGPPQTHAASQPIERAG